MTLSGFVYFTYSLSYSAKQKYAKARFLKYTRCVLSISDLLSFTYFMSIRLIDIDIYIYHPIHLPCRNAYQTNRNIWYPRVHSTVQKCAKHTGSYSCTVYISVFINVYTLHIYSRLPRPRTRRYGIVLK